MWKRFTPAAGGRRTILAGRVWSRSIKLSWNGFVPTEARIETEWSLAGQPAVIMENRAIRAAVLPGLGGKMISLIDKHADTELLWRNPRIPVRASAFGSEYDDQFLGGWDELFPNDIPEVLDPADLGGEMMPDHGELWSLPWRPAMGADDESVWLELRVVGPLTGAEVVKTLTLGESGRLVVDYRIHNPTPRRLPFLWKVHLAVDLHPDTVIDMAAHRVLIDEFGQPRARPADGSFCWPLLESDGKSHDFRRPPEPVDGPVSELLLATGLERGECGVRHPSRGTGLRLSWDARLLPSCWSFATYYGAWRGLHVLVLEPSTGHPASVAAGVADGTHRVLPAGGTVGWQISADVGLHRPASTSTTSS